ncbi:polysaccharide biosynthesis tyrosine autokinase [Halosquirtibacter xylanolyticus]|uniref:polysaccharide biosynthesis tyrosine autokinase n=1 Tax=Halosquirtibacter xylanolyticus TaxID=3374599 RepID=UPI003748E0FE|nr:polysaccharide biosynthesis tyrosine autokinase [Prolixibacteraceae bacterium]
MTINSSNLDSSIGISTIEIKKILETLYHKKLWILASLGLSLLLGVLFVLTRPATYQSEALFMVEEESVGAQGVEQMSQMMNGFDIGGASSSIENQIAMFTSYDLVRRVVTKMDLELVVTKEGLFKDSYCYRTYPFDLDYSTLQAIPNGPFATIVKVDETQWEWQTLGGEYPDLREKGQKKLLLKPEVALTGDVLTLPLGEKSIQIKILPEASQVPIGTTYQLSFRSVDQWTTSLMKGLTIAPVSKKTSIVRLRSKSGHAALNVDFLNQLMDKIRAQELAFRNRKADGVIAFVDQQLKKISDSLQSTESSIAIFQEAHAMVGLDVQSQTLFDKIQQLESKQVFEKICLRYGAYLSVYLSENQGGNLLSPAMMGVDDPVIQQEVEKLNRVQGLYSVEKEKTFVNGAEVDRLFALKTHVSKNLTLRLAEWVNQHKVRCEQLEGERQETLNALRKMPKLERAYQAMQRHYKVQSGIYDYLLMQRTTSQITKASNRAKGSVVEVARLEASRQVAPKKPLLLLVFVFLGVSIPVALILLHYFLADRIQDTKQVAREVGDNDIIKVGHSRCGPKPVVFDPLSVVSEQFYQLRTMMEVKRSNYDKAAVYLVSSANAGEGKTFVSVNMALTYAKRGAKVLLIGTDLRKPRLQNLLDHQSEYGLIDYLEGVVDLDHFDVQHSEEGLDLFLSGKLKGANPADLLACTRMRKLMLHYRDIYDVIILDTAPLGLVPDTLGLLDYCDRFLFVVRKGVTPMHYFSSVWRYLQDHNRYLSVDVVLNDVPGPTYYQEEEVSRRTLGWIRKRRNKVINSSDVYVN